MPRAFAIRIASSSDLAAEKSNASKIDCFFKVTLSFLELCDGVILGRKKKGRGGG